MHDNKVRREADKLSNESSVSNHAKLTLISHENKVKFVIAKALLSVDLSLLLIYVAFSPK